MFVENVVSLSSLVFRSQTAVIESSSQRKTDSQHIATESRGDYIQQIELQPIRERKLSAKFAEYQMKIVFNIVTVIIVFQTLYFSVMNYRKNLTHGLNK